VESGSGLRSAASLLLRRIAAGLSSRRGNDGRFQTLEPPQGAPAPCS
jgi:hypothetical protein